MTSLNIRPAASTAQTTDYGERGAMLMHKAGAFLRELRRLRKLSQSNLAEAVEVGRGTIERLEAGDDRVSVGTMLRVLHELDASPWHFYELAMVPTRTLSEVRQQRDVVQGISAYVSTLAASKKIPVAVLAEVTGTWFSHVDGTSEARQLIPDIAWLLALQYLDAPLADLVPLFHATNDHVAIGRQLAEARGTFVNQMEHVQPYEHGERQNVPSLDGVLYRLSGLLRYGNDLPAVMRHELTQIEAELKRYRSKLVYAIGCIKAEP